MGARIAPAAIAVLAAIVATAPVAAVGLGPLKLSGMTATARRGFQLSVINSEPEAATLRTYAVGTSDETPQTRVTIWPATVRLAPGSARRVLVIAEDLSPGETLRFRVCSERADEGDDVTLHARVCSRIEASRLTKEVVDANS